MKKQLPIIPPLSGVSTPDAAAPVTTNTVPTLAGTSGVASRRAIEVRRPDGDVPIDEPGGFTARRD